MMLLVLLLLVIALPLCVAGYLLGSVAMVWTSVGVSFLAGVVLLLDFLQIRAAERSGRQEGRSGGGDGVQHRSASHGVVAGTVGGPGADLDGYREADMEPATQVLPVVPPRSDATDETVVMPVVAPSGSPKAPPGASQSGGLLSPTVTDSSVEESAPTQAADDVTTAVDPAAASEPGGDGDSATGTPPPAELQSERALASGPDVDGAARTPDAGEQTTAPPPGEHPEGATQAVPSDGVDKSGATVDAGSEPAAADKPISVAAAVGGTPLADDRTQAAEPIDMSGEAPEEPHNPAHASLVARLPDEVVVIDEHPRYHLQRCPSLPGQPLIPLQVNEAIELGFTPCGWCTPNHSLGTENRAEVG